MCELTVKELLHHPQEHLGKQVHLQGWVRTVRDVKACAFVELNDGSVVKNIQLVCPGGQPVYDMGRALTVGTAVEAQGTVTESQGNQPIEIQVESLRVEGECPSDYPLQKKRHSVEYLRTIAHLRPRTNLFNAAFRVRSEAAFAIHEFFHQRGFVYAHTPIITASDAEGAGDMFRVTTLDLENLPRDKEGKVDYSQDFFGSGTNLTVSGQLEAEIFALAFKNTYTFGPTFRSENSNTSRHAAEFWMIEPEIAFADLKDNMALAKDMMQFIIRRVLERCPDEMEFFNKFADKGLLERLQALVDVDEFAHVTYTEAIDILLPHKDEFQFPVYWGCDLQSEHERFITEKVFKKPTFMTDYPKEIKAFYMRLNDDGKTVAAMDMLVPGIGELIGGSQREERFDVLKKRMDELGMEEAPYWWYMDLRKYGGTKHAGYGLGFERLIMYLTGISNIRDVLPFPRTVGSADF